MNTGASFNTKNELVKATNFSNRKPFEASKHDLKLIKELEIINYEDIIDVDNPSIYNWYQIGDNKYNRFMYCPKTHTRRTQTMGEFYGDDVYILPMQRRSNV